MEKEKENSKITDFSDLSIRTNINVLIVRRRCLDDRNRILDHGPAVKGEIVGPWTDGDPRAREGGGIVRRRGLVQDCNDSPALWVLF